ncbi:alpha/beta fold hydrolase [Sphingomonas colocasiae]|uniref:Alpha/beta hydrolase n=1 Tax=Sphingomonas colocasiae TaxID=1848973 RepID=A0ABS7PR32_9SPHN|nr:alpha/beta hydrolase [Sphingomonas colocasiae]MBY8823797.1 alpha/beta hydrolase [Sphingomonas colocasiae]
MLTPVLFLPGLLCDATLWRAQIDDLADIAAPMVADLTLDDSVAAMAARTLAAAPPRFSLVALSMGGYVAFEIMRQAPERVVRLALLATSAAPDDAARAAERRGAMESLRIGKFMGVTARLLPQLVHPSHVEGPVGEAVTAMAQRVGRDAFLRQQQAILTRPDSRPALATIAVPTIVGVGDGDRLTPPAASREIHAGIAGARLHVFEKCGHLPALEAPAETSALLREWLQA